MGKECPEDLSKIDKIVGSMFQLIREDAGVGLKEIASYLRVSPKVIRAHESGDRPLSSAELYLAGRFFEVKISAFFQPYYLPECFERDDDVSIDG